MKKIFLTFILFSCICISPSFSMKLIITNEGDRTVPSRTIRAFDDVIFDDINQSGFDYSIQNNIKNGTFVIPGYQAEIYETYFMPWLKRDIRKELIGTTWKYPDYIALKAQYEQRLNNPDFAKSLQKQKKNKLVKRFAREASDYFYRDTIKNPDKILQSGFELVNEE